ncbi:MAG: hypothetical protein HY718_16415, partial [Planctomycetes bacterium]|nr:hypothetical protein [Planctomycetota bacterium]
MIFWLPGDPNRLVKEVRTGSTPYHHEYWYDVGGNRLAMKKSVWDSGSGSYKPTEILRYNYAYKPNFDGGADPRVRLDENKPLGEPLPNYAYQPVSRNTYQTNWPIGGNDPLGQDKLLSYRSYRLDLQGQLTSFAYTAYEFATAAGKMSRRMEFDDGTRKQVDTTFTYSRGRLQSALVTQVDLWPTDPGQQPNYDEYYRFLEQYAYNIFGDRVGVMHCARPGFGGEPSACKGKVSVYDYVDGQLLAERESDNSPDQGDKERYISVYTWGPLGVIARKGVSFRDAVTENTLCDYTCLKDAMGNVAALVDSAGTVKRQVFDAFGNWQGSPVVYVTYRCAQDQDNATPPQPVERMQTGQMNWRGGEGSATDWAQRDLIEYSGDPPTNKVKYWG